MIKQRLEKLEQRHPPEAPYSAYIDRLKELLKNEPPPPKFSGTYLEQLQHAIKAGTGNKDND